MSNTSGNTNANGKEKINLQEYTTKWDNTLKIYSDNYIQYLTKKVKDRNDDTELREKVINTNEDLQNLILEVKNENDEIVEALRKQNLDATFNEVTCNAKQKDADNNAEDVVQDSITINKKIKNITEKQAITKKLLTVLYVISGFILFFNLAIFYFNIKKK